MRRNGPGRRERRIASGSDLDLLRLDREIADRGLARWAFAVARVDDRFSGLKPAVDRVPPWPGWDEATITYVPSGVPGRLLTNVSHDVWTVPVSTLTGLWAINDGLLSRGIKGRSTFILDTKSMAILEPGREPLAFRLRLPGEAGPLWAGFVDPTKRHFRVMCIFCRGPVDVDAAGLALWRRRHQTKDEPGADEVAETCDMLKCGRPVFVPA